MQMNDASRYSELELLALAAMILLVGFSVTSYFAPDMQAALTIAAYVAAGCCALFLLTHGVLRYLRHRGDPFFLPVAGMLTVIGLIYVFRLRPALLPMQMAWFAAGSAGFIAVTFLLRKPERLQTYKYLIGLFGVLLILSTILFGVEIGGNRSWINLGFMHVEPAEFAKILLVIFLAGYMEEKRRLLAAGRWGTGQLLMPHAVHLGPMLVMWGITLSLLVLEKDLGAALLYYGTFLSMLYMASNRLSYVFIGLVLMLIGGVVSYQLFGHVQVRFDIWLNPWTDPDGRGYQIVQSLFALGTGGILGTGLATGRPEFIPAVHTDFVFAAIGEELGLAGTLAVLLLYVLLVYRGFRAALRAENEFCALLAAGLSSLLAVQIFVIIGGVTKLVPLTGVTMPFVSYGGSSMLASFLILALLHNISENG